ncbi:P-loop NTPase [Thermaerobacter litoralis]
MSHLPIRVLVADTDPSVRDELQRLLKDCGCAVVATADSKAALLERTKTYIPDVVLSAWELDGPIGDTVAELTRDGGPAILATTPGRYDLATWRAVRAAGCHNLLRIPIGDPQELLSSIEAALASRHRLPEPAAGPSQAAPGVSLNGTVRPVGGRLIAVYSHKGGVGKSTVAANLAVALRQLGSTVALVDLDSPPGSIGTIMGAQNAGVRRQTINDWQLVQGQLISWADARALTMEHPSGVHYLPAANSIAEMGMGEDGSPRFLDEGLYETVLTTLLRYWRFVIADCGTEPELTHAGARVALRHADDILLVTTPSIDAIVRVRSRLNQVAPQNVRHKARLIVNMMERTVPWDPAEIAGKMGLAMGCVIARDPRLAQLEQSRGLAVVDMPRSDLAKKIQELAANIEGARSSGPASVDADPAPARRRRFALFGRRS